MTDSVQKRTRAPGAGVKAEHDATATSRKQVCLDAESEAVLAYVRIQVDLTICSRNC